MNRLEEYDALLQELESPVTQLEHTLERAEKRRSRKNYVWKHLLGVAAAFTLFVLLVNFSVPVAYACAQIPVLRGELGNRLVIAAGHLDDDLQRHIAQIVG